MKNKKSSLNKILILVLLLEIFTLCIIISVIHILNIKETPNTLVSNTEPTTNTSTENTTTANDTTANNSDITIPSVTEPQSNTEITTSSNSNTITSTSNYTRINHDTASRNNSNVVNLDVNVIYQLPELPTGCEITSLAMVLNYFGYNIDKETLANDYLEKGTIGVDSYKKVFLGDPHSKSAYGCFAPVIVNSANKYLSDQQSDLHSFDLTGSELNELFEEIRYGIPVIIWGSLNPNITIQYNQTWIVDSEILKWPANEHCMVLTGFDLDTNTVTISDPLKGVCVYDYNSFLEYYVELGRQAVILDKYN